VVIAMDLESANEHIDALEREIKILRDENSLLKQGLFGRRSERVDQGQLDRAAFTTMFSFVANGNFDPRPCRLPAHFNNPNFSRAL
jgi:hypothetical protein